MIDVRCRKCNLLLCQVSEDFTGTVAARCRKCGIVKERRVESLMAAATFALSPKTVENLSLNRQTLGEHLL